MRPDNWLEFLQFAYNKCPGTKKSKTHIKNMIKAGDLLTACSLLKTRLDDDWFRILNERFSTPAFKPGEIHTTIYGLDCALVLTTNFDRIYETKAGELSSGSISTKQFFNEDLNLLSRGDLKSRAILKIHGSLDDKSKMIFTKEDYARQRNSHPSFFKIFEALLCTNTFLFIGCSLTDPDLNLLLEDYNYTHSNLSPHYALMPKGQHQDLIDLWRKNYSLRVIEYSPKNNHSELLEILKALKEKVEQKRNEMGSQLLW